MFCCLLTSRADVALSVARACSPRIRVYGPRAVFDVSGCSLTIGPPATIASEVLSLAKRWSEGPKVRRSDGPILEPSDPRTLGPSDPRTLEPSDPRVAVAPTVTMAWLLAHARPGVTVVETASALFGKLPVGWLGALKDLESSESSQGSRSSKRSGTNPSNSSTSREITRSTVDF